LISVAPRAPELEKYELIEEIGHGGMATVYRARDRRLGREVAVKLIHPHLRESAEVAARFVSEARAVAKLRHPNIVEVYDISDANEAERYLVVELIRGTTLRQLLKEHGRLPVEVAVAITLEIAAALNHAHVEGVIHRDIKPENVLVRMPFQEPGGERHSASVKLTDFGIAKLLDVQGITSTGQVLGSPAHMAPEQIEGAEVDGRADVFGLGVLLYECWVGSLPFSGKNPAQVLRAVLEGVYSPAERERPEIGSRYGRILARALAKDANDRFASISAFANALGDELKELEIASSIQELDDFLSTPSEYVARTGEVLVPRLLDAGDRARRKNNVTMASAHFNRALSYRPADKELLARVSGLARRRHLMGVARWGGVGLLLILVTSVVGFQLRSQKRAGEAVAAKPQTSAIAAQQPQPPTPAGQEVDDETDKGSAVSKKNLAKIAAKKAEPRKVEVGITGAMGGSLRIDGEAKEWFGVQHELEPGEHVFEFVPPNDTCCVPQRLNVLIKEGADVQRVVGNIAFRDAILRANGDKEADVTCAEIFSGTLHIPGERSIPMSSATVSGHCTILPRGPEGALPQREAVVLQAGQTTVLSWP
jgi:serine/threonine-protein kinase